MNTICKSEIPTRHSQESWILQDLMENGSVTARDLWSRYGIGSPRKAISVLRRSERLKEMGYEITDQWEEGHNKFGQPTRYKRYILKEIVS